MLKIDYPSICQLTYYNIINSFKPVQFIYRHIEIIDEVFK